MKAVFFRRGFTLIEVLVVITIIGLLSTILYASFNDARVEAKNRAMLTELREVQLALELYKAQNGEYPPAASSGGSCSGTSGGYDWAQSSSCGSTPIISGLIPEYISELPDAADSANGSCNLVYQVGSANHDSYKLTAISCHGGATSQAEGIQKDDEFARCPSSCSGGVCDPTAAVFYESYAVYSIGGKCW